MMFARFSHELELPELETALREASRVLDEKRQERWQREEEPLRAPDDVHDDCDGM